MNAATNRTSNEAAAIVSVLLLFLDLYYYGYGLFASLHLTNLYLDQALGRLQLGQYGELALKGAAIGAMVLYIFGSPSSKSVTLTTTRTALILAVGLPLYFLTHWLDFGHGHGTRAAVHIVLTLCGFLITSWGMALVSKLYKGKLMDDRFNTKNEQFNQEKRLLENPFSVNIRSEDGYWNFLNPFSGTLITGNPGTGKTYVFVQEFLRQLLCKGFTMCIYDYKNGELTGVIRQYLDRYKVEVGRLFPGGLAFNVIDFDNPEKSGRINPLSAALLEGTEDCIDAATIFMRNVNKTWAEKQGDFFPESAITLVAMGLVFLKHSVLSTKLGPDGAPAREGNCCSLPHLVTLLTKNEKVLFEIFKHKKQTRILVSAFSGASEEGAVDQLQGQLASVKIALARLATPKVYWVLSGEEVRTDVSSRKAPQILCLVNNGLRKETYSPALGLILGQVIKRINTQGNHPCLLCVDELSTIYIKDVDNLIATARSNQVATLLCFQDFSQLVRDYGKRVADVVINTMGNIVSGKVYRETARDLQEIFGKILQLRQSISTNRSDTSISQSTQMDYLIPAARISSLSQGEFVGILSDTVEQPLDVKFFRSKARLNERERRQSENLSHTETTIGSGSNTNIMEELEANFEKIDREVGDLLIEEYKRWVAYLHK